MSAKFIAKVRKLITGKRRLLQMMLEVGCSGRLFSMLRSLTLALAQPSPALSPLFPALSSYFCSTSFIRTLDSVEQEILSQCRWDLQGRLAFELFTTLSILFAYCDAHNYYANMSIAVRLAETVEYFARCFAPLEVQLKAIFNVQSVRLAVDNGDNEKAVEVMKELADIRALWGDLEGLFYINFALGQAYYHGRNDADTAQLSALYLQRALNCANQVYAFANSPSSLAPAILCQLFLSDLGLSSVFTPPFHKCESRSSELLDLAGFDKALVVTEHTRDYAVTALDELQADEETLAAYFRSSAGAQQILFLYKYSVVVDD